MRREVEGNLRAMAMNEQEMLDKMRYEKERFENGNISEEYYNKQMESLGTSLDFTRENIETELRKNGVGEQEWLELRENVVQDMEQGRGR